MAKQTTVPKLMGDFPGVVDMDIGAMYAYAPPSPELSAQQKEDRTRKTCDVHLKRIADHRKEYFRKNGLEETYQHPDAPKVTVVSWSAFATRYQEMLLTACLNAGITLSWDESINITDTLVANTETPGAEGDPKEWVDRAVTINNLMKHGIELTVNYLSPRANKP